MKKNYTGLYPNQRNIQLNLAYNGTEANDFFI